MIAGLADRVAIRIGGRERLLPIVVAVLVLVGSLSGVAVTGGATGGTSGPGDGPRLGLAQLDGDVAGFDSGVLVDAGPVVDPGAARLDSSGDALAESADQLDGPYLADGTLLKPIAVSTTVADGADRIQTYKVQSGDTLTGIARHFGISMMTIWWANHLKSKDQLTIGQKLLIPPINGIVRIVKAGDTLESISAEAKIPAGDIAAFNGLTDTTLTVGQTLILPGAQGKPIPTPKPVAHRSGGGGGGGGSSRSYSGTYSGGIFAWPVPGGTISQYFSSYHPAIDIQAPYGSRIVAAAGGKVIWAGWKSNGGGYQVWIAHGSGLYTTYNHMSAIGVGAGQYVSRGQFVGRVGTSGWATGPHCHFEVWRGEVWGSGYRVNPLNYF